MTAPHICDPDKRRVVWRLTPKQVVDEWNLHKRPAPRAAWWAWLARMLGR